MNLFKLFGIISVNNDEANSSIDETSEKASTLSKVFKKAGSVVAGTGKVLAAGIGAGVTAFGKLTYDALQASGELEQNMGGSEAVFKQYASSVQATAKDAYAQMGLSTSDFLATANKMGSLFQGAGFDIAESSELATQAMQRAADVASIMGIDTSSAMESIAGAAKGNFTMMDNLGVAMNETTLAAYALEKGMEKSYSQMTQQEKIGVAMKMFLDRTTYAAGNYAKENKTLAGALNTAKAAMKNFLDGSGDVDQLVDAFTNASNVIITNLQSLLPRLVAGISQLISNIIPLIPGMMQEILPSIIAGAVALVNGLVDSLPELIDALIAMIPGLIAGVWDIFNGVIAVFPEIMATIGKAIEENLPAPVLDAAKVLFEKIKSALSGVITAITTFTNRAKNYVTSGQAVNDALGVLRDILSAVATALEAVINWIGEFIDWLVSGSDGAEAFKAAIIGIVAGIVAFKTAMAIKNIITGVVSAINAAKTAFGLFNAVLAANPIGLIVAALAALAAAFVYLWNNCESFRNAITSAWNAVSGFFVNLWGSISSWASGAWTSISNAFSTASSWFNTNVITPIANFFSGMWTNISTWASNAWINIHNAFLLASIWFNTNVITPIANFFSGMWTNISTWASDAWKNISDAFNGFVQWVTDNIITPISDAIAWLKSLFGYDDQTVDVGVNVNRQVSTTFITDSGNTFAGREYGFAKGGVFTKPTFFNTRLGHTAVAEGGEAEAVAPISVLQGYVRSAVDASNTGRDAAILELASSMRDLTESLPDIMRESFASMRFEIGSREFARMVKGVT